MKWKWAPILQMLSVAAVIAAIIVLINASFQALDLHETLGPDASWILAILVHIPQFVIPFLLIWHLTNGKVGAFGFNRREKPPLFTHRRMLGLGAFFGLVLSLKYIAQIAGNAPLDIPRPVALASVVGNMAFQWIVVGVSEETLFRGLIQTYLMKNLEGHVQLLGHEFHVGTVIGAIIWGAFHFVNVLVMPWDAVVFYVALTTMIGLPMGYAYQETGSLFTTVIVHNTLFGVPLTLGYILHFLR